MEQIKLQLRPVRPVLLRLAIMAVLIVACLISGAAAGYGVLGKGDMGDVFKPSTWKHVYDLVYKD